VSSELSLQRQQKQIPRFARNDNSRQWRHDWKSCPDTSLT